MIPAQWNTRDPPRIARLTERRSRISSFTRRQSRPAIAASGDRELLAEFQLMVALGTQALESMPAEQLQQTLGYVAASTVDGSSEQTDLVGQVDVRDDLAGITAPTLVISTTDDRLTSTALHRQLAETIPGAHLAEIATGHLPMLERTDEWLQLITDFLDKHNA